MHRGYNPQSGRPVISVSHDRCIYEGAHQHTIKYPPAQPVTIIPIATGTLADPKTFPTTVGIVEKKPPFDIPLIMTKTTNGPIDVDTGQSISMLRALSKRDMKSVFNGPTESQQKPQPSRPMADEKLKAATKPAPTLGFIPIALVYKGR